MYQLPIGHPPPIDPSLKKLSSLTLFLRPLVVAVTMTGIANPDSSHAHTGKLIPSTHDDIVSRFPLNGLIH